MHGGHALRQESRRQAEEGEELGVPVARMDIPQLRARGALRFGGERPLLEQAEDEEARHRPPGERARLARRAHRGEVLERPAQLARAVVRREVQAGLAVHRVAVRRFEARDPRVRAPVLPAEDRRQRAPGGSIPAHGVRALAGEAGAGDLALAYADLRHGLRHRVEHRGHDFFAVLLRPVRLRMRQGDLARAFGEDAAGAIHDQRAAGVRALVDGEGETHTKMLNIWRASV